MTATDPQNPLDEAIEWCVRLEDADVTATERQAFEHWLASDPAHVQAWQRAQQVWQRSGLAANALPRPAADDVAAPSSAASAPLHLASRQPRRRRLKRLAFATAAALLLAVGLQQYPGQLADYKTSVAEQRSLTLEDGSTVHLAPDSALDVEFSAGQRLIRLHRGEALFSVAANAQRPFIVQAKGGSVRALGTAFDVKISAAQVAVTVTEHAVRVQQGSQEADLQQGQALHYNAKGISSPQPVNLDLQLAWRQQRLAFQNAPLAEVIAELQRYSSARLIITDQALGRLPVTAAFDTREPQSALNSLGVILPLQISHYGPWLTLIGPVENNR